jgi:hypothetical protein
MGEVLGVLKSTLKRKKTPAIDDATQAEIEAEQAANQRAALVRKRRRSSTLFGAGNRVLGTYATTPATPGATALGSGGGGASRGGGGGGGGRGGGGRYAVP